MTYSKNGLSKLSQNLQTCCAKHLIRGKYRDMRRPVLINSWEACYFHFNGETILNLAREAKKLGVEMLVMDDGWFGKRDNDFSGLGDWFVNEKKLGCTLGEMVGKINDLGVKFGIWFEPEMVSEDSDLYRNHPDWVLQIPGRKPIRSRYQLVLDFSREEVRNYIFDSMCAVLDQGNIEYVKWDMNRSLIDIYSAENVPGAVMHKFVLGVYDYLEKLLKRYPNLLIEGCCGGGGRFDAGMMYYTPQIWCSDNTDAIDRTKIQFGSSFFYPASVTGAHVSAVPNHQTGRITSLKTRGVTAMAGTFGYELNPALLSEEEREEIKKQIKDYKKYARMINHGSYYRLSNPFKDAYAAWQFVSEDEKTVLLNAVMLEVHGNMTVIYIFPRGLKENGVYVDEKTGIRYYGAALMSAGIPLPAEAGEYLAYQMELTLVS